MDIDDNDYDIIIIGGGLTGLTAAYNILKKNSGLTVLIIEEKDAIGGCLHYGDIGFYAHSYQMYIQRLVNELNLTINISESNDNKQCIFITKNGVESDNDLSIIDSCQIYYFIKSLQATTMESRFNNYTNSEFNCDKMANISVNDILYETLLTSKARLLCKCIIYAICGINNLNNVSLLWLLVMLNNSGGFFQRYKIALTNKTKYFIKGGMMEIINQLRCKIVNNNGIINCSERVEKIIYSDIRVWIKTSLKTYKCNYVVIAVPPPLSTEIIIEPILSSNLLMTQSLYHREKNIYFQIKYKSDNCNSNYNGSSIISTDDSGVNIKIAYDLSHNDDNNDKLNIIGGYINESIDNTIELLNIFQTIDKSFEITDNNYQYNEYKCDNHMAVLKPCPIDNHINPMLMPLKRIYFASSEYAREYPGTADGAIEAGEHVACFVLHHIRPQTLNISELMKYIPSKIPPRHKLFVENDWACGILMITNIFILITFLRRAYIS